MTLSLLLLCRSVLLLIEPLSAVQLIAAGVLIVSVAWNAHSRTFLTYVLTNAKTGQVYIGRTSGFGEPSKILKRRLYGHRYTKKGFGNAKIDVGRQGLNAYFAIRGREQQLIDFYGGIGHPKVANIRRGVARSSLVGRKLHYISNQYFGNLHEYTGK